VQPVPGVSLEDKLAVNRLLLASGADIQSINTIRKHLSQIKGGNLARLASPATVVSFILSDVIGNDLSTIGSGPTVADPTTFQNAWDILERYNLLTAIPQSVNRHLTQGLGGLIEETPKPGEAVFSNVHNFLVGSNSLALEAAACIARQHGFTPEILPDPLEGDTTPTARAFAQRIQARLPKYSNENKPVCLLAGGETTVHVTGKGKGGRNQEFALVVAQELQNESGWTLLSAGTDGIDGPTDAAGAFVDGHSLRRAREKGLDPHAALKNNDTYPFFAALDDLFQPGATGTNVMDMKMALIA
jgi:hydroxypyruvate reductase